MSEATCKRKKAYPIRSMAERDLINMNRDFNESLNIYECEHCNKLHIGHKDNKVIEYNDDDFLTII